MVTMPRSGMPDGHVAGDRLPVYLELPCRTRRHDKHGLHNSNNRAGLRQRRLALVAQQTPDCDNRTAQPFRLTALAGRKRTGRTRSHSSKACGAPGRYITTGTSSWHRLSAPESVAATRPPARPGASGRLPTPPAWQCTRRHVPYRTVRPGSAARATRHHFCPTASQPADATLPACRQTAGYMPGWTTAGQAVAAACPPVVAAPSRPSGH